MITKQIVSGPSDARADGAEPWTFRAASTMGFAAAVARFTEQFDLVGWLNARLAWDPAQCHLSPGTRLFAMAMAFLVDPQALYKMVEFYQEFDCEVLFGAGVRAEDFTDDAFGRALLKFLAADPPKVLAELSAAMIAAWHLPATDEAHADTTTVTLTGAYAGADAPAPPASEAPPDASLLPPPKVARPAYGHNKDGKNACKQLVAGIVARADGIPIAVNVNDGNLEDSVWTRRTIRELSALLEQHPKILFVADSKMVNEPTLDVLYAHDVWYVSRLPNSFGVGARVKLQAVEQARWKRVGRIAQDPDGATYAVWETTETIGQRSVRLIVVKSSALAKKAQATVPMQQEKMGQQWDREARRLERQRFDCDADARKAFSAWQAKSRAWAWWTGHGELVPTDRRRRRPGGGHLLTVTEWRWQITRGEANPEIVEQETVLRSLFVLIANAPEHSAPQLLAAYKRQAPAEIDHHLVKGPLGVAPVFLKDPAKITAYVYVVYIALMIWQVMQAVARRNAEQWKILLPYPNGQLQPAVTTQRIKEILSKIQILRLQQGTTIRRALSEDKITWLERVACMLLGVKIHTLAWLPSG